VNSDSFELNLGEILKLNSGESAALIVVGPLLDEVKVAISGLGIELHYTNSISAISRFSSVFPNRKLIIVEPYYSGALYQQIQEELSKFQLQVLQIGVPKVFVRNYGSNEELLALLGLDSDSLRSRIKKFIES
jgi:deoxyxylulose-5-phosphate synthase